MARYGREIDNVRAALDWSFSSVGDVAIGVALTAAYTPGWLDLSLVVECRERLERALERLESDSNVSASLVMRLRSASAMLQSQPSHPAEFARRYDPPKRRGADGFLRIS
jgi:hypothetical protein